VILAVLPADFAAAAGTAAPEPLDRLQRADHAKVVPERFFAPVGPGDRILRS
jgi:hypothetical protein